MIRREILEQAAAEGRIPHACFLSSADPEPSLLLARSLAAKFCHLEDTAALSRCPDYFEPEVPLRIDPLRELLAELQKAPFRGQGHAVLLRDAHTMDGRLQNLLLKTLEEPPAHTLFLLTGNDAAMLPTVLSRCALLRMGTMEEAEIQSLLQREGASPRDAALYSAMGGGLSSRSRALCFQEEQREFRQHCFSMFLSLLKKEAPFEAGKALGKEKQAPLFVSYLLSFLRDLLLLKNSLPLRENPDLEEKLVRISERFTSRQINCMIDAATEALRRSGLNVPQGAVLDRLFTDILEVIK